MRPIPDPVPPVSVVIPAYNRETTIAEAVQSVLRQSFRDFELIVVDDASTDGTVRVVEAIGDRRVRLVRRPTNGGGAAARNTGIAAARGNWVAFQDSDDEWLPRKLECQLAALDRAPDGTVGVYCGMIILGRAEADVYDPGHIEYRPPRLPDVPLEGDLFLPLLRSGSLISTQTFMGRRDVLVAVGGFDPELKALQDWDCFIRVALEGPIAFEPEPLVLQRFSPNSLTRIRTSRAAALARILEKHRELLETMPSVHARHLHRLAGMYRSLGHAAEARGSIHKAFRLDPANPRIWAALALATLQPPAIFSGAFLHRHGKASTPAGSPKEASPATTRSIHSDGGCPAQSRGTRP